MGIVSRMPRPVWTGSISFGMVAIPIRLVPAVRKKSISFNQLDDRDQSRIRYRKVNEDTGEEVPTEHIVKGYDIGSSSYVILTDDDLAPAAPAKSKEINLETFVPVEEVNPMMYDSSYLVLPDKNAKPYALLAEAMADTRPHGHRTLRHAPEGVPGGDPLRRQAPHAVDAGVPRRARDAGLDRGVRAARRGRGVRQGADDGQGARRRAQRRLRARASTPTSTAPPSRRSSSRRRPA